MVDIFRTSDAAMEIVKEAIDINPDFADSWFKLGNVQKQYADYFREIRADLNHAQSFYFHAIESYQQRNKLEYSLFTTIEIANVKYNLAKINLLKGKPQEAMALISDSIKTKLDVVPFRHSYFSDLIAILETQVELLQLQEKYNQSTSETSAAVKQMLESICVIEGITETQKLRLNDFSEFYQCQ